MLNVLLFSFVAGVVGTTLGGIVGVILKKKNIKIGLLYGFAGGVMLSMVLADLVVEAIYKSNVVFTLSLFVVGYLAILLIDLLTEKYTYKVQANRVPKILFADKNSKLMAVVIVVSIAVHNLPEGMIIGATSIESLSIGYVLMIALHNIPEGMAVALPLMLDGEKPTKAVAICFLTGLPTILGAVISYYLGGVGDMFVALCLAIAGGAMSYVVLNELLPSSFGEKNSPTSILLGIILGLIIIFSV